ncbi:MBL fold metallo-hydrolase [Sphingomonas profundi]|uniref:MBL fold metallo-hydrolase n=1 Tax=Alterirhizorhabdus profundi TaxID=2681549 RepID=UPI0012E93A0D|nr:MBL fold metallo-hydrolase [Sphingomonas profundi]
MKPALRRLGAILYWLLIGVLLVPVVAPPFLDRIYYRGPVSDHFDGTRFFNPDGEAGWNGGGLPIGRMLRFMTGAGRTPWPASVAVRQMKPEQFADDLPPGWVCLPPPVYTALSPLQLKDLTLRVTWIGHATTLVQSGDFSILTDPVWSDRTGPFGRGPKRVRAPGIRLDDLPKIDLVLISHNHYDHLDLPTLRRLWLRDRPLIVTSLGNDAILREAGISSVARDWGQRVRVSHRVNYCGGFANMPIDVIVLPVHHWGSRWFADRNRALWSGFRVGLPGGDIVFAGDTGFGDGRWIDRMAAGGPIRLAILPIGAYKPAELMRRNHIGPAEAVEVFRRLRARNALAIHWGTFQLADEGLNEAPLLLADTLRRRSIPAGRFRALEPGVAWDVPPLP